MTPQANIPNSSRWWKCEDCGNVFLVAAARLSIPVPVDEQAAQPLCKPCWERRFEEGLMQMSGQANPRANGEPWL
jgi:hypothetical protein